MLLTGCEISRRNTAVVEADTTVVRTDSAQADTSAARLVDRDSTADQKYEIDYRALAQLPPDVQRMAKGWATEQKNEFLRNSEERSEAPGQPHTWELLIDFEVPMDSGAFVSAVGEAYAYTGGAHGIDRYETFNYNPKSERQIAPMEVLTDTAALRPISTYAQEHLEDRLLEDVPDDTSASTKAMRDAMRRLRAWIREGTAPIRGNYRHLYFVPAADGKVAGLGVIFSRYQVAPGAAGAQTVFVPTSVFRDHIKADYRDRFSTGARVDSLRLWGNMPKQQAGSTETGASGG